MIYPGSHSLLRKLVVILAILTAPVALEAQFVPDPDPNSPTPVLLTVGATGRAVAVAAGQSRSRDSFRTKGGAFAPGSEVKIFVSNLSLIEGEGANSIRVDVRDARRRTFRFPVLSVEPTGPIGEYAVTIRLRDVLGFWKEPAKGDVLIYVSWRGLASNSARLGYGATGGRLDQTAALPTAMSDPLNVRNTEYAGYRWSGDRMRFLQQATFGATQELDSRIRRIGPRTYLAEQFEALYPSTENPYPDIPLKSTDSQNVTIGCGMFLPTTNVTYQECIRDHYTMYPVQKWFMKEALYGSPQLRHRIAWALAQLWVISGVDIQQSSWMIAYHKVLSQNAFGNYRTLMREMSLNPGMGEYLDMARSTNRNPNENYPREIMQLFTIGLFMLNQDGTLQLDGQGDPIPTYDQTTVDNFTKVFTGWSFCNQICPNSAPGIVNFKDPMILNQNNHDITAKTLLEYPNAVNQNIAAGLNGSTELDLALDNIFNHPNVGPFVSKFLIQHLVTSDPTPAYVGRIAAVFNNNGLGVRGDLKSVIRAILLDPEARGDIKTDPNFGKLREPVQYITNVLKTFNVKSADLLQNSDGVLTGLTNPQTQSPFMSPTVFNFYPPDYVVPGTTLIGPEFGIMTTGTAIARANFVNTMVFNRINVSTTNTNVPLGTALDLAEMEAVAAADPTGNRLLDELNFRMMHGRMSAAMRAAILPAFTAVSAADPRARAQAAIYLVASSSQYQIQR